MKNRRNYYRILQVQPDAQVDVIRSSFRTLMRDLKQHPDLGGSHWNAAVLNEAYETLNDAKRRADYDRQLYEQYTKRPYRTAQEEKRPLISIFCPFCKRPLAREPKGDEKCLTCQSPLRSPAEEYVARGCRRFFARINKNERISYYVSWPQKAKEGQMADLSPRGMLILCSEYLPAGAVIKISSSLLKATACVTYCQERIAGGKKLHAMGVKFIAVSFQSHGGCFVSTTA